MRRLAIGLGILALCSSAARAQAAEAAPAAPATDIQGSGTLSDKLSATSGVIHPKADVDPDIKVAPPSSEGSATMPVIPPPGTPGGDQTVKPK